jgi:glycerate 2-kinase
VGGGRRVVLAPDKFKGSLPATRVARALARGIRGVRPQVEVVEFPVADGGEGTVELCLAQGFEPVSVMVSGPLGEPVRATFALRAGTAVIESASAIGLSLLGPAGCDASTALRASTYGVGQLIKAAVEHDATRVVVGLGGSASTDGGAGAVVALGGRVIGPQGSPVPSGGAGLDLARRIDLDGLDARLDDIELVIACDVDNPLTGPCGAAFAYGAQKGVTAAQTPMLDEALTRWADLVAEARPVELRSLPGAGAAGGLAFGLAAVCGGRVTPGADLLMDIAHFDEVAQQAHLVIVGEGSFDRQSLRGKGPVGVARRTSRLGGRAVAVVGRSSLTDEEVSGCEVRAVYTLTSLESDPTRCMTDAEHLLEVIARRVAAEQLP